MLDPMYILYIPIFNDNYIWLILDVTQTKVIAVDPGDAPPLLEYLKQNNLQLAAILITHHHGDHTGGVAELTRHYPVPVYGPDNPVIPGITHPVKEADTLVFPFLECSLTVLETPGHTLDHIAYLCSDMLFCGDTLFSAGCGRVFEGTVEQMVNSLQKIAALPDETKIYCTHEYTLKNLQFAQVVEPHNQKIQDKMKDVIALRQANQPTLPSCLRDEKAINPFLRCDSKEIIDNVENYVGFKLHDTLDVFKYLREWKNDF